MIKLKDILKEDGGTGAMWGLSTPDYISVGKPKKSKTKPSGLKQMEDDDLTETSEMTSAAWQAHRNEMLKYIPKQIDQYHFLGKNDEGQWELSLPAHPEITITATPFIHGTVLTKVIIEKGEDIIDEFTIKLSPSTIKDPKTKQVKLDPKRDAERYTASIRDELGSKLHPEEL